MIDYRRDVRGTVFLILREAAVSCVLLTLLIGAILWQAGTFGLAVLYALPISLGLGLLIASITTYAGRDRQPIHERALLTTAISGLVILGSSVIAIWLVGG